MALSWAIAGGGTGGHVTPALALGEAIAARGDHVVFIGSERGLESKLVPDAGFELVALGSQQVMGRSLLGRLLGVLGIVGQVGAARSALRANDADVVVSVGGYAAMPTAIAAVLTRRPLVLVEPNAIPGRVNRLTARFAKLVFVGFDRASLVLDSGRPTIHQTGIPLRSGLLDAFASAPPRKAPEPPLHLFVFGGSQGARQINEAMMEIAPKLAELPVEIFHQTGEADRERVAQAYAEAGVRAEVAAFEHEMPTRYRWADLALCRAGALTVAELALAGLPALLVPYPFAADDHQTANAKALAESGAGRCLDSRPLDIHELTDELTELLLAPDTLARMSASASALARPNAARDVVDTTARLLREGAP
ncbi:MAG: undecaprenyldiphospho-muramoylpentapeptide beta-N-acetylglucosaminyltransferase [Deltaproteobacteria bacterium]|nr:undecaprenyldiphospho-muramoylpentapeptide beta-N-acetylglucosaminyltransferase [Deltaproteobacteria bacterium]